MIKPPPRSAPIGVTSKYLGLIVKEILAEYANAKKGQDVFVGYGCLVGEAKLGGKEPPPESCFTRRTVMQALKTLARKGYKIKYGPTDLQEWDIALVNDVPIKFFFKEERNPFKWVK